MTSKPVLSTADEKTRVINSNASKDASIKGKESPGPFASLFKNGKSTAKRTIVAGAISGGLLAAFLSITSFVKKGKEQGGTDTPAGDPETPVINEGDTVAITTSQPVYTQVHDDLSLEEVREIAREQIGPDGFFIHDGEWHYGISNDEWAALSNEQRLEYFNNSEISVAETEQSVTVPIEIDGRIVQVHIDPLHRGQMIQEGWDDDGNFYVVPQGGEAFIMDNVVHESDGINYWIDPETGSRHVFNIVEVYQQINEHGAANLQTFLPDREQPVAEGDYIYSEIAAGAIPGQTLEGSWQEGWGWDTDRDGIVDLPDPNEPVETWTEAEDGTAILQWTTYPDGSVEYPEVEEEEIEEADSSGGGIPEEETEGEDIGDETETDQDQPAAQDDPDVIVTGEIVDAEMDPTDISQDDVVTGEIMQDEPGEIITTAEVSYPDQDQPIETDSDYNQGSEEPADNFTDAGSDMDKDAV